MRSALVSPRVTGYALAPSWTAIERVLWLAVVDRCLRVRANDSRAVRAAYAELRACVDGCAPSLYRQAPVNDAAESRWIIAIRETLDTTDDGARAAIVLWAAVETWTDAPDGRWAALADAGAALATALDAEAWATVDTGRVASKLRAVMAGRWATIGVPA